jgi:hypothetical protein
MTKRTTHIFATILVSMIVFACSDGDDGDDGWTEETCDTHCDGVYAEDLEDSEIAGVMSSLTDDGDCKCIFQPCSTLACIAWCVENEDIDSGHCNLLECICDDDQPDAG